MYRLSMALCCLAFVTGLGSAFAQPAAERRLDCGWTAIAAQRDGKADDDVMGHRLSVTSDRFQIQAKNGTLLYAGTVRLDPGVKPAAIDFQHTDGALKGKVWKGIYAIEGDTLTICDNAADSGKPRPVRFEATSGSGHVLVTFKRAKP